MWWSIAGRVYCTIVTLTSLHCGYTLSCQRGLPKNSELFPNCKPSLNFVVALLQKSEISFVFLCVWRPWRTHQSAVSAAGQWRSWSPVKHLGLTEQGRSTRRWTQWAAGSTLPLWGQLGSAGWGLWGKSWHLMGRLCVFSCERPLNPTRGISSLSPAIVLWIFADHPQPNKHSKAGKRRALAADQQDIFTVEESICYCEPAPVSCRMFGSRRGTLLALRRWDIPLHLIFSLKRRGELGRWSSRLRTYLCACR